MPEPRRDPETKPVVPDYAEKMDIIPHIRHQFHPIFKNIIGGPDANGPKAYLGIDFRCPVCQHIQPIGPPGLENECTKCEIKYKYTAAKGNCFLWIWRSQKALVLESQP